jgi:hypothetical protein
MWRDKYKTFSLLFGINKKINLIEVENGVIVTRNWTGSGE